MKVLTGKQLNINKINDSDQCICKLGVNQNTGRVQWCPGFTCCKFFILLPVIMLPLTLVLMFFVRVEGMMYAFNLQKTFDDIDDADFQLQSDLEEVDRVSRCMSLKFGLSEAQDIEELDLMRDARTSFIPRDTSAIPRECLDVKFETALPSRSKRASNYSFQNIRQISKSTRNDRDKTDSMGLHFIWKAEDSKEEIRRAQAETMIRYMDTNEDPCNDFYKYACGNWEKINPIPKDKAGFDTFEMLRENLDVILEELLQEKNPKPEVVQISNNFYNDPEARSDIVSPGQDTRETLSQVLKSTHLRKHIVKRRKVLDTLLQRHTRGVLNFPDKRGERSPRQTKDVDAETKAKLLYQSCINNIVLEKRGISPLLNLIRSLGGWPVLDRNWSEEGFDWLNLTAHLRLYNNDIFIVEWVGPDLKNSNENIIHFDQTSLGLPTREYFLENSQGKYLKAYKDFMQTVMHLLGASQAEATKTAEELVAFESQLAAITSPAEERVNVTKLYKKMAVSELNKIVPKIDWKRYLTIVQERPIDDAQHVVIFALDYMNDLVNLIRDTQPRIVANYLMWRFVRHRINNVDDRFEETKQKFFHALFGREESPSRWKVCIAQVNSNMGMALGAMFVRKYFDENSKEDTLKMTHELQQAFRDILHDTDWIDDATKKLAEEKVNMMSLKIGYPDDILVASELNEKYKGIDIHPDKYFENTLNVLRHTTRMEQQKMLEPVNKTMWQTPPAIVNAYYSRNKNQIMFPAGILQPPFYHRHFPRSLNFGGIGVVIGHELTHGFDDKGRLFDSNGSIHKWWSDSAVEGFDERARCLIAQYGNYTVSEVGITLNGESTQGENIADNGGIRQAFHAYQSWLRKRTLVEQKDEMLPGLNMTGAQLFFLNFAQVWCGAMRPEATRNKLNTAIHSPGRFRVIGTLSNSEDFAREFQCESGSPMNPVQKCGVW